METPTEVGIRRGRRGETRSRRLRLMRIRVGRWILREAATVPGAIAMTGLAFLGSAFVPIALEPFLIILTTNLPHLWRRFALCFATGSILGGVATYVIGYLFSNVGLAIVHFWGEEALWETIVAQANSNWWLVPVGIVAVGPGPTKLVTMAAGAANLWFPSFLVVLVVGRLVRFLVTSWFARIFGRRVHDWYVAGNKTAVYVSVALLCAALLFAYVAARALLF